VKVQDLPGESLLFWFAQAELLLNCSHVEAGNPALLEGVGHGVPALAADIAGNRAFIINDFTAPGQGTGFLYSTSPAPDGMFRQHDSRDFLAKLETLLKHPERAREAGARGAQRAKKSWSPDLEAFLHQRLYQELARK
jgi:glycosyltransferase involved in cell wall biosynthesis